MCDELSPTIGDSLFSQQSALQLDRLVIKGHLTLKNLRIIRDRMTRTTPACKPLRELVLEDWDLSVLQTEDGERITLGATLAALIRQIGGVELLRIQRFDYARTDISFADVLPLTICRELHLSVDTNSWEELKPPTDDNPVLPADAKLERLVLRLSDWSMTQQIAPQAIRRLLEHVGPRLRSLSILPHSSTFIIDQKTAKAVVELCPNLETLHIQYADDSFGDAFVEALVVSECCRVERLSLRCRHSLASMFALVSTLRQSTHPLSRSLRSLRFDIHEMQSDDDNGFDFDDDALGEKGPGALNADVYDMLQVNQRLRSVTIRGDHTCDWEGLEVEDLVGGVGTAVALPPLRHRLATLSALRRYNLPQDFLIDAIMLAGHPVARLQFGDADDNDAGRFYEGEDTFW
ncbi:hypothetical protein PINS_up019532 [Pythium insidiosum]|nr:hypothetical protein PINS_up019532 [Pythium insidiosum]